MNHEHEGPDRIEGDQGEPPPPQDYDYEHDYVPPAFRQEQQWRSSSTPPPAPFNPISRIEFERVFGGRVLAWIGGLATLLGVIFLMRSAVDSSWFTEEVRTLMAGFGSLLLLALGLWLHERKGRLEVARIAVAIAIPGLYATTVVAAQVYDLISPVIGLEAAALIGAVGVFIAVRWSSMLVGSVGMLGALAAPMLVGGEPDGASIAFVALALAASVGVLLWQRWNWLALGAFAVSAPQLILWIVDSGFISLPYEPTEPVLLVLAVLVGFWILYAAAAFGYELRNRGEEKLPVSSWLLLLCSSLFVYIAGCVVIPGDSELALNAWTLGFAGAHLLLGAAAVRFGVHREIGSLLVGGGIGLGSFGLADALDGPTLVAAWSALAGALAYMATRADRNPAPGLSDAQRLLLGAFGFLGLALLHVLCVEAPPAAIAEGVADLGSSLVAIVCCAGAALACWYWGREIEPKAATVAGFVGAGGFVYLGSVLIIDVIGDNAGGEARQIGQSWLSAFWTATGLGAVVWGMVRHSPKARLGGLALLAVAIVKVWTYDLSELEQLARALSFVALGLLLLAGAFAYQRFKPEEEEERIEEAEEGEPRVSL
jgi:uncharacterized membrane protein